MTNFSLTRCTAVLIFILLAGSAAQAGQGSRSPAIPPGTQVQLRLLNQLDTGQSNSGQTFAATVARPVVVGGRTALARGIEVEGRVSEVVSSGRLKRPASITLQLTSLPTDPLRIDGKSHLLRNVALIGGSAAAGALIGGVLDGKKGAALGAGIGTGGGTATAYMTGKKEIVLPVETELTFVVAGGAGGAAATTTPRSEPEAVTRSHEPSWAGGPGRATHEEAEPPEFSDRDQELILRYFRTNTANLPPGLAKRGGNLPPGLERHLERNGTLPPGLQKRVEPFPMELSRQLPRLPAGYSRVILGDRALLLDPDNEILDLMFIHE